MAAEALTPSTENSSSVHEEASSGVHSGEEREEVVIRPSSGPSCGRPSPYKPTAKALPPPIAEEPFGRSTNMRMSSFNINLTSDNHEGQRHSHQGISGSTSVNQHLGVYSGSSSATLPMLRSGSSLVDYLPVRNHPHCNTMPLPGSNLNQVNNNEASTHRPQGSPGLPVGVPQHTTLPNGVRYANPMLTRRVPLLKGAESPYGVLGRGSGHHTFSKHLQDPLLDTTNYAMISEELFLSEVSVSRRENYVALPPPLDNNSFQLLGDLR